MDGNDCLSELPPSAKLVYKVLQYDGPLTQKQLVEETMLSARTVRYALERLQDCDRVEEGIYFADARQSLYELSCATPSEDDQEEADSSDDDAQTHEADAV
ncbi:MAG: winged helix-turn-helix transcriptional regulator [Halobacteriota archaeon]